MHICLCKVAAALFCHLQAANVASLLGNQGIGSGQIKLTYKGKGRQLFLRETVGAEPRFFFPFALIKRAQTYRHVKASAAVLEWRRRRSLSAFVINGIGQSAPLRGFGRGHFYIVCLFGVTLRRT